MNEKLKPNDEVTINVDLLATLMKLASGSSFDIGIHVGRNHCMTDNDFIKWRNEHIKALLTAGLGREVDDACFPMYER